MVTVRIAPDCGNAPRREITRDLVIALADNDARVIEEMLAQNGQWTIVGAETHSGRDAILQWVAGLPAVRELEFGSVLTHGKGASVDGTATRSDGTIVHFSHVLEFAGHAKTAPLASVRTYEITDEGRCG